MGIKQWRLMMMMALVPGVLMAEPPAPRAAPPVKGVQVGVRRDGGGHLPTAWIQWCSTVDRSKLARWERQWLDRTPQRSALVWVTNYGPWDPQHYRGASWHIAANPKYLKPGTVVFMDGRLKVVTNRGASSNDTWAQSPYTVGSDGRRHPKPVCEFWIDRWTAHRRGDNAAQRVWVIGRAPWRH